MDRDGFPQWQFPARRTPAARSKELRAVAARLLKQRSETRSQSIFARDVAQTGRVPQQSAFLRREPKTRRMRGLQMKVGSGAWESGEGPLVVGQVVDAKATQPNGRSIEKQRICDRFQIMGQGTRQLTCRGRWQKGARHNHTVDNGVKR